MLIGMNRTKENKLSTLGNFSIDGKPTGLFCLEDGYRKPKVFGQTRIPAGTYKLKLRTEGAISAKYLARFGADFHHGMIWLQNVPDFQWVYIHCGNHVEETDGCLLTGTVAIPPAHDGAPYSIGDSEKAYRKLYPQIADAILDERDVRICVRDISKLVA